MPADMSEAAGEYFEMLFAPYKPLQRRYEEVTFWPDQMIKFGSHHSIQKGLTEMQALLPELQRETAETGKKIAAMPDFQGDASLRDAVVEYLKYLHRYCKFEAPQFYQVLRQYAHEDVPITEAEEAYLDDYVEKMDAEWDEQGKRFEQAQDAFAKRYGFNLLPDNTPLRYQGYRADRRGARP
jgi:hypothetical protein